MTRVEALTWGVILGEASPEEREELSRRLEESPDASRVYLSLLESEWILRADGPPPGVEAAVMEQIRTAPARWSRRVRWPSRVRRYLPAGLVLAVTSIALGLVGGLQLRSSRPPPSARNPATATGEQRSGAIAARTPIPPRLASARAPESQPAFRQRGTTILALDFEDGLLPPGLLYGVVVSESCGPASHFCAVGGMTWYLPRTNAISITRRKLFSYSENVVITFDYRLGAGVDQLDVQVLDQDRHQNYHLSLRDVVANMWAHGEARLVDFVGNLRKSERMEPGDRLDELMFLAGEIASSPFYIDNIRIVEHDPRDLPSTSSGGVGRRP